MTADALVLIGPMGAGKTSVGKRVAKALGIPFIDTDASVAREHGAIPELFATHGEAHFRSLEREAVSHALQSGGVVALGGGAVLDECTQSDLASHRVILLTVSPDIIAGRIGGTNRPLLQGGDALERWNAIYQARLPVYHSLADVTFDTSRGPLSDVVDEIIAWVGRPVDDASTTPTNTEER